MCSSSQAATVKGALTHVDDHVDSTVGSTPSIHCARRIQFRLRRKWKLVLTTSLRNSLQEREPMPTMMPMPHDSVFTVPIVTCSMSPSKSKSVLVQVMLLGVCTLHAANPSHPVSTRLIPSPPLGLVRRPMPRDRLRNLRDVEALRHTVRSDHTSRSASKFME